MKTDGDKNIDTFERLRFEHELINNRLTWPISSQSILFAAYGVAIAWPTEKSNGEGVTKLLTRAH